MNSSRRSQVEVRVTLAIWLALVAWAGFAAPVGDLPRSPNSWDVLHSGRQFAERGFIASKLQPRWSPPNHESQYLTYTHYPPLPYWIAGGMQTLVRDPRGRIDAMLRLVLIVGISAVLCGYLFLRNVGIGVPAAALAGGALVWSHEWWTLATGELTWVSWLQLFQLGGIAALSWALGRWRERRRPALCLSFACACGAALSAFDAWPWVPTLLAVLTLLSARLRRGLLPRLALLTCLAVLVSVGGAATRVALNWWHFGSIGRVIEDVSEAYGVRSTLADAKLEIPENRANYESRGVYRQTRSELALQGESHSTWIAAFFRVLPGRLSAMFLPEAAAAAWSWAWAVAAVLAVPGWLSLRRTGALLEREHEFRAPEWLLALTLAGVPFVLICPAIAAMQYGALLTFAPALLLAFAWICEGVLASLAVLTRGAPSGATPRRALTFAIAAAVVASPILRGPGAAPAWPAPPSRCEAAVLALAHLKGVVFVDLADANLLMFLAPLDSSVSFKPTWSQRDYFPDVRPIRLLRIVGRGRLAGRDLSAQWVDVGGVPEGFELLVPRAQP